MSSEKEPSRGQTDVTKSHQAIDTSKHEQDDDDLFREVYTLEDQLLSKGLQEGHEAGRQLGWLEGRDLGLEKGSQIGEELGYYAGIAESVVSSAGTDDTSSHFLQPSSKCCKTAQKLLETISTCQLHDPQSEEMMDSLQSARARFKVLMNLLKLTNDELAYDPDAIKETQEMSF